MKMNDTLKRIQNYTNNNELMLNIGKTTITEFMVKQKKCKTPGSPPSLNVRTSTTTYKEIKDKGHCKILGAQLQANLTWNIHLEKGDKALFPAIRKTLGAIQYLGRKIPRCHRKPIIAGLIQSRLMYLLPLWGAQDNMLRKAQIIWNKAARWITGQSRRTRTVELMEANNWMSIREMVRYHGAILTWKTIHTMRPRPLYNELTLTKELKITNPEPRLQISSKNFKYRSRKEWNEIPEELRCNKSIANFKTKLKMWIKGLRHRNPD